MHFVEPLKQAPPVARLYVSAAGVATWLAAVSFLLAHPGKALGCIFRHALGITQVEQIAYIKSLEYLLATLGLLVCAFFLQLLFFSRVNRRRRVACRLVMSVCSERALLVARSYERRGVRNE